MDRPVEHHVCTRILAMCLDAYRRLKARDPVMPAWDIIENAAERNITEAYVTYFTEHSISLGISVIGEHPEYVEDLNDFRLNVTELWGLNRWPTDLLSEADDSLVNAVKTYYLVFLMICLKFSMEVDAALRIPCLTDFMEKISRLKNIMAKVSWLGKSHVYQAYVAAHEQLHEELIGLQTPPKVADAALFSVASKGKQQEPLAPPLLNIVLH